MAAGLPARLCCAVAVLALSLGLPASQPHAAAAAAPAGGHAPLAMPAYATNFSSIDHAAWTVETGCFSCKAPKHPETTFECTNNTVDALRTGSQADGTGLTIVTSRLYGAGYGCHPAPAGGTSGHISSKQPLLFGTIRVKAQYFPGSAEKVSTAKGFVGLEDPHSGAITITMHGAGGVASGEPPRTNWTHYMQSSCYRHGDNHEKTFDDLGADVNAGAAFNDYEIGKKTVVFGPLLLHK
jgi:hypothetical protein